MDSIIIWGFSVFVLVFLVNYFLVLKKGYRNIKMKKSKKKKRVEDLIGLSYIVPRFNLDINNYNLNVVFILISLINAFIISLVFSILSIIAWDMAFRMLLGFVLLLALTFSLYEILGRLLKKKGKKKNV